MSQISLRSNNIPHKRFQHLNFYKELALSFLQQCKKKPQTRKSTIPLPIPKNRPLRPLIRRMPYRNRKHTPGHRDESDLAQIRTKSREEFLRELNPPLADNSRLQGTSV